jgi:acylphosphatase
LPLFSKRSARIVASMDGMLGLVRHDADGNVRVSACGYRPIAIGITFSMGDNSR